MKKYKVLRLTKPMKICGDISTTETFKNAEAFFNWLTQEYISKPLTCELVYSGGRYAVLLLDEDGNYKVCKIVLEILKNKIRSYTLPTAADELQIARFMGLD